MCLVAMFYRVFDEVPVVIGANREEAYARGGLPPTRIAPDAVVAGLDPVAGGTWLAVADRGLLVAVTNRQRVQPPTNRRSRGLLVVEALRQPSATAAADLAAREWATDRYDGFNLLCVDAGSAVIVQGGDWLRVRPLPPGLHLLTNRDANDPADPRIRRVLELLRPGLPLTPEAALERLATICGTVEGTPPICLRGQDHGTVCSTLIALADAPRRSRFLHAPGAPDRTPYQDRSDLLIPPRT